MYITLGNPYVYILYVYYVRIKLTGFCLVVEQKRESEFKMVVTVGLKDISSMYT